MEDTSPSDLATVKIWINEATHKVLRVPSSSTGTQVGVLIADLLQIPHSIRPYFATYITVNGADQGMLDEKAQISYVQQKNQNASSTWGESHNNGLVYRLTDLAREQWLVPEGVPLKDSAGASSAPRAALLAGRKIGHQRSHSNPTMTAAHQHATLHQHGQGIDPHKNRQPTKHSDERFEKRVLIPSGIPEPEPEGENEAKTLGAYIPPHLEPRTATIPSPSPPRASLKSRSKTIAFTEPMLATLKSAVDAASMPLPTTPKASTVSPRGGVLWGSTSVEGLPATRSRAQGGRRPVTSVFYVNEAKPAVTTGDTKGRSASPPPPRQRYTPPPTILSPMVASVLSTVSPPGSPSVVRQRAQTTGSKPLQKWIKVHATQPSAEELKDVLQLTLDRLSNEHS